MNEDLPFPIYLFIPIFPALWCLVLFILSRISGWTTLAESYSYSGKAKGKQYSFQSARINMMNFNSSLVIAISDSGLYLAPFLPFRLFHKPLLIPWTELQAEKHKRFLLQGYRITTSQAPNISIVVSARLFARLAPYHSHLLPV